MIVLGIESTCDESAVALVTDGGDVLSHKLFSQIERHKAYQGVVPEIAARAHLEKMPILLQEAMLEAGISYNEIDGIAVASGPGLIGGVIVGLMFAKSIASVASKPLLAVNHLAAHILVVRMLEDISFPYLSLLVSGGHCQLVLVHGVSSYEVLGTTLDDSVGECFDKVAKMLGLGYPGGPEVEKRALLGDASRFNLPAPLLHSKDCNFSFSGLKTAVLRAVQGLGDDITTQDVNDICASFQQVVGRIFSVKVSEAIKKCNDICTQPLKVFTCAGGVAANKYLRSIMRDVVEDANVRFCAPDPSLCTDNGIMIAWNGIEKLRLGFVDGLDCPPRARWPLKSVC